MIDRIRHYHLNTYPLAEPEELDVHRLIQGKYETTSDAAYHGEVFNVYEDYLNLEELSGFTGQCTYYLYNQCIGTGGSFGGYPDRIQQSIPIMAERETADRAGAGGLVYWRKCS